MKVAILDDYAGAALRLADWSEVSRSAEVTAFDRHIPPEEMAAVLRDFAVVCTLRERSTISRDLMAALPALQLITVTDPRVRNVDFKGASARGILISEARLPGGATPSSATAEFAWGLLLALVRNIPSEAASLRAGRWQSSLGMVLAGRTLGLVGLGKIGRRIAHYARAFDMNVLAWSQNLTREAAEAAGATWVEKEELFHRSDIVSIHYALGPRSLGLVGAREIAAMKPSAYLLNTSRGPIVDEGALLAALQAKRIAGAGLDVFDREPLPDGHPFLALENVVLTPHLGFVTHDSMQLYYKGMAFAVGAFLRGDPVNPL
jgi:phosphoglycerate dehydrogenase-like enzyme